MKRYSGYKYPDKIPIISREWPDKIVTKTPLGTLWTFATVIRHTNYSHAKLRFI